jgi:uncharacterized membrane-anchored protein YitT (DUF2179 family)
MQRLSANDALRIVWQVALLSLGAFISAVAVIVFEAPARIAPGGVSGLAIILNYLYDLPIGLMVLIGNIPIQVIAYRMLGGWRVVASTVYVVVLYSLLIDLLTPYFPPEGVSSDTLLNALFGGIVTGIGSGIIYRVGGTLGGTSTLGRILQERFGIPFSSSSLYTDSIVIAIAGLVFGWEGALYAMVALYVTGATSDYVLEGPSVIRTAVVITDKPREVSDAILENMRRGVTAWEGKGMFTDQTHTVLYVTIGRAQVNALRRCVFSIDSSAFVVIGQGHSAYGHGFREIKGA